MISDPPSTEEAVFVQVKQTEKAANYLDFIQSEDNFLINEIRTKLHESISYLIEFTEDKSPEESIQIFDNIRYLNTFSKNFKDLMMP